MQTCNSTITTKIEFIALLTMLQSYSKAKQSHDYDRKKDKSTARLSQFRALIPRSSRSRIRCCSRSEISASASGSVVTASSSVQWISSAGGLALGVGWPRGREVSRLRDLGGRGRRRPGGGVCCGGVNRGREIGRAAESAAVTGVIAAGVFEKMQ